MHRLLRLAPLALPTIFALGATPLAEARAQAAPAPAASTPAPNPADVASVDAIIAAVYDVISGAAGQARNWDRMRSLFIPGARLIPTGQRDGTVGHRVLTVEDYISANGPQLEKNGFFEREIGRKTETFGNVTHVFSTYDSKRTAQDEKPFSRGINSIQLLNDGKRWWIVTIFWDSERPNNPIPQQYLTK